MGLTCRWKLACTLQADGMLIIGRKIVIVSGQDGLHVNFLAKLSWHVSGANTKLSSEANADFTHKL